MRDRNVAGITCSAVLAVLSAAAVFALSVRFAGHCLEDEKRLARAIR